MGQYNSSPDLVTIIQDLTKRVAALENTQDTGWVPLVLAAGITPGNVYTPSARLRGYTVSLKGQLLNSSGAPIPSGTTLATVPTQVQPAGFVYLAAATGTASPFATLASVNGGFITMLISLFTSTVLSLDGLSYALN